MENVKMNTKIKYFIVAIELLVIAVSAVVLVGVHDRTSKPYVQTITEEEEGEGEECTADTCGDEEEDASVTSEEEESFPPDKSPTPPEEPICKEDTWSCGVWSTCDEKGFQARTCKLSVDCETADTPKPTEKQSCTPPKPTSKTEIKVSVPEEPACTKDTWECTGWNTCSSKGIQTRTCKKTFECSLVETASPDIEQKCTPAKTAVTPVAPAPKKKTEPIEVIKLTPKEETQAPATTVTSIIDRNQNGIPDIVDELTGQNSKKEDPEDVKIKTEFDAQKQKLIDSGMPKEETEKTIQKLYRKKTTERKIRKIREAAKQVYQLEIEWNTDDANKDGISDEVAVSIGMDPKEKVKPGASSRAELKIYNTEPDLLEKKCTTNIYSGIKLSVKGFVILAACPKNKTYTLYIFDKNGNSIPLETRKSSENNKVTFDIENDILPVGRYLFQVRPVEINVSRPSGFVLVNTASAESKSTNLSTASDPVLVELVEDVGIPEPIVKSIENVEVSTLKDIKISATKDGKVRVSGTSDISSTVVGTFQSAVFTSAMLADLESGAFSIVSPQPLPAGEHEVVIYAARPEESIHSAPVKLSFTIIETARAAAVGEASKTPSEQKEFPIVPVVAAGTVLVLVAVIAAVARRKKKVSQ